MNSHLYKQHICTLYEQLKEKYTDEEILNLIRRAVRVSTSSKIGGNDEHTSEL